MIAVTGASSAIARALRGMLPAGEIMAGIGRTVWRADSPGFPRTASRFLLCAGLLHGKAVREQRLEHVAETMAANLGDTIRLADAILNELPGVRVCILGSESGYRGSHDMAYAAAKAGLHAFVEQRRTGPQQQLVAVAPHIIADAGMTLRRRDIEATRRRAAQDSARGRWITAAEVAAVIRSLLYDDHFMWCNNTVIRLHGGRA